MPSTTGKAFYHPYATLHVPATSLSSYQSSESWKFFKKIVALTDEEVGINDVHVEGQATSFFILDGQPAKTLQKGVNIIRYSDGKTKKVFVK